MADAGLIGMSRRTGGVLGGIDHLRQSIDDILTTPIGSRVERPDYGSKLPRIVDQPITKGWMSAVQAEVVRAILRWEPRLKVSRVIVESVIDGRTAIVINGEYLGSSAILEVTV
jgi:phage baseplate assembly protein W